MESSFSNIPIALTSASNPVDIWPAQNTIGAATAAMPSTFKNSGQIADHIRMKPNVVNLLPTYPDLPIDVPMTLGQQSYTTLYDSNSFENLESWQITDDMISNMQQQPHTSYEDSQLHQTDATGHMIFNQRTYLFIGPHPAQQVSKPSITEAVALSNKEKYKNDLNLEKDHVENPVEMDLLVKDKLSLITADALLRGLDLKMSQLHM